MKTIILVICMTTLFFYQESLAQETQKKISTVVFVRQVNALNTGFENPKVTYSPVLSSGMGFSKGKVGTEIAFFINKADVIGFYSFNTFNVKVKPLEDDWKLVTNIFGEYCYLSSNLNDGIENDVHAFAAGLNMALVKKMPWGAIALPLIIGPTCTADGNWGMTTRCVMNLVIKL